MTQLLFCFLVIGSSLHCAPKKHDGPPLLIKDIYTDGKPDIGRQQLLSNIQRAFPVLSIKDIEDCIAFCLSDSSGKLDIIEECQELMFWKMVNIDQLPKNKSCFDLYKRHQ